MFPEIPSRTGFLPGCTGSLHGEQLESRWFLSATTVDDTAVPESGDIAAIDPQSAEYGSDATELWQALAEDEILAATEEVELVELETESADPLPVIPFDETVEPLNECPGLDSDFCLPGDANLDGTVDFSDYLLLNENYGLENATWSDGDFDGDGIVAFSDYLLLTNNFGAVI